MTDYVRCLIALTVAAGVISNAFGSDSQSYRSPLDLAYSPDGTRLAVSDHTAGSVVVLAPATGEILRTVGLAGEPTGLVWSQDGQHLYVADSESATVCEIDTASNRVVHRFPVGPGPHHVVLARKRKLLIAANTTADDVSAISLTNRMPHTRIRVVREPSHAALSPDESIVVIANALPAGSATDPRTAAAVTLIDLATPRRIVDIRLPPGSTNVRGVTVAPNGRWAYAVHTVGRFNVPTTQLERGWINTNAISVIDLGTRQHYATCLLDHLAEGAADPYRIVIAQDGVTAWITLGGIHQLARIDLAGLHDLLEGRLDSHPRLLRHDKNDTGTQRTWLEIAKDPSARALLVDDLTALHAADLITRIPLPLNGPRGLDLAPDGRQLAVAGYFSGNVVLVDTATGKVTSTISLGPAPETDTVRRGEMIFHDATYCYQHWSSCATCHADGRSDGLNWDLLNDGLGNPKNTKSLLLSHETPPVMSRGVRASMEVAAVAGFRYILFSRPQPEDVEAVQAYLRALEPARNPHLSPDGTLSPGAARGKAIFESGQTRCAVCHPAPLYTDLQSYDVGTRGALDRAADFDTPTLIELWRSAPYLHDGSAATLGEVLTKHNQNDQHGQTSHLTDAQLHDLIEFLLSN